jgi:cytosine/creatinine deaminase
VELIIRGARLRGRAGLFDIGIQGGRIAAIEPHLAATDAREIDAGGCLVTPSFVEPHTHLDKALTAERCPPNRTGLIDEVVFNTTEVARAYTVDDVCARALELAGWFLQNGVTHIRTHVDVGPPVGLTGLDGVLAAREALRDVADIQIVAFAQWGIVRNPETKGLLQQAIRRGADLVGSNTVAERTQADSNRQIDIVFEIAREFDVGVDIHCDSTDDATATSLHYLAVRAIETGYHGRVAAGHCCAMSAYDPYYAAKVARLVKEAGISIVTMPLKMLYAGLRDPYPKRRGMTRIDDLLEAQVNVCTGQDNVLDGFSPCFGRADPLETALLLAYNFSYKRPEELETVFDMTTVNAARAIGLDEYDVIPGKPANLNILDAQSVQEAIRTQAARRYVLRDGRVVVEHTTTRRVHGEGLPPQVRDGRPGRPLRSPLHRGGWGA